MACYSMTSSPTFCVRSIPVPLTSLLFPKYATGPLHWLLPLPEMPFPATEQSSLPFLLLAPVLLFREAYPDLYSPNFLPCHFCIVCVTSQQTFEFNPS